MAGTTAVGRCTETTRPVLYKNTTLQASPRLELEMMCLAVGGRRRGVEISSREPTSTASTTCIGLFFVVLQDFIPVSCTEVCTHALEGGSFRI